MKNRTICTVVKVTALVGMLTLAACNTIEGVGKDVERGGEKLQDVAK